MVKFRLKAQARVLSYNGQLYCIKQGETIDVNEPSAGEYKASQDWEEVVEGAPKKGRGSK